MFVHRLLFSVFLLLAGPAAVAGTISPGLESLLQGLEPDETIKVLVVLEDQADIAALDRNLRGAKAALPHRHEQVVRALREVSAASQTGLLAELSAKSVSGEVRGFVSHWLINSVVVTATSEGVRRIAARPDVERVEPDLTVSLISPLPSSKSLPAWADSTGIGIAPGVQAVGAPQVWRELGIDGTGTIVGILDTGVDGAHPALAARWRGNFAPASACWLDAADFGDPDFPADHDTHGHGTHVMGTITGLAPGDTIGVAPGARWIAANPLIGGLAKMDNAVLASLEFMTDPDGDPTTSLDVPDVVQNSWGINEAFEGYIDCDSRWWDAIDNCEAAGVVLVWAAGNEGATSGTLRSPADRASTPNNCFSVGATSTLPPFDITEFSSRGPSGCGGAYRIKPEVVAPGLEIYSAAAGGGFKLLSGTSMAGPHVAGVVALMRQASPDIDVTSIKEILMAAAVDLGDPGEDNTHGHGFIDAYAAVSAAMDNVGTVAGTVTDGANGLPLAGVTVRKQGGFNSTVTDAEGHFSMTMSAGPASFLVVGFGYFENEFFADITPGGVSTHTVLLDRQPHGEIHGLVTGPDGHPVPGAMVAALGTPVTPVESGPAGTYSLSLPNGTGSTYNLHCSAPGLGYGYKTVELVTNLTVDFSLPELFVEDFETGNFLAFPWLFGGDAPWTMDETDSFEGLFCARSGVISDNQVSVLELDYYVSVGSYLQFWSKVSSEFFYDNLLFYLDGELMGLWSGERDWEQTRLLVARGHHTFKWVYQRDEAYSRGQDAAWIDIIEFPTTGEELFPKIDLDNPTVPASVATGDTTTGQVRIYNIGDWVLDFSIGVGDILKNGSDNADFFARDEAAIFLDPSVIMATVAPNQGQIVPGSDLLITVTFDATMLEPGFHLAVMTITSTDPVQPDLLVPLMLTVTAVSDAPQPALPAGVVFTGAVPNPFNPATRLKFSLPRASAVTLDLFDVSGRRIRSLVDGPLPAGPHEVDWDGRNDAGGSAASGTYFARLTTGGLSKVKSVTLVR